MIDWSEIRGRFPAVEEVSYLNTAAGGPISTASAAAGREYYEATCRDGDVHWDGWLERVEEVRVAAAQLLRAQPLELGFIANASIGMSFVAGMLRGSGEVVVVQEEFPSVTLPWLQLGYPVRFVAPEADGGVPLDRLADALTPDTRILALGLVHYRSGFRYDLGQLGRFAREHDLRLAIDATQGLGALAVDLSQGDVDFMVASGYKWLTAGYGVGLLYINERHLTPERYPAAGWRSAEDPYALIADRLRLRAAAAALELGHPPFAGVFSLGAALELLLEIGPSAIEKRVLDLNATMVGQLRDAGYDPVVAASPSNRSGIVYLPMSDAAERKQALDRAGVLVSHRGAGLRLSTHFYTRRADVARLLEALG